MKRLSSADRIRIPPRPIPTRRFGWWLLLHWPLWQRRPQPITG
jgi:hypothetical protein